MKVLIVLISLLSIVQSQKNLALNGTASQSSVFHGGNLNFTADLAITGGPTHHFNSASCSTTLTDPKQYVAWWMLTFPVDTIYITNVTIYYRDDTLPRLAGYYLYISNSSVSKTDGHLCYHDEGPELPDKLQDVNCNHLGQNVIFYNERDKDNIPTGYSDIAMLELCHVEIYGCYKGWWGGDCSTPCPVNCIDDHCYPGNGSCVWGCKIGQDGDMCDRPCEPGTFGQNCEETCHCINQPCDSITGVCPSGGCTRGYTSSTCSTECSLGYYGYNCNQSCDGCLSHSCDDYGDCTYGTGCNPGWQPGQLKCDRECDTGTFGVNCGSRCDTCVNRICDRIDGHCIYGCIDGFKGNDCQLTECDTGTFGVNCGSRCDTCVNRICDRIDGHCIYGCIDGFKGNDCQLTECDTGTFGVNCGSRCDTCVNRICDRIDGHCIYGCIDGFKGNDCQLTECSTGTFGVNCGSRCYTCVNRVCNRIDGRCIYGCIDGFKGHDCQLTASSQPVEQSTNDISLYVGVTGTFIATTLMCVIIFQSISRYRRKKKNGSENQQSGQKISKFVNDVFIDDYTNIGSTGTEAQYEENIHQVQEQPYDSI